MTVLTHQEAAAFLKVNDATLRKLRRSGEIHGTLVGAQYRYVREHLEAYLELSEPALGVESGQSAIDRPRRPVHHRAFYSLEGKGNR